MRPSNKFSKDVTGKHIDINVGGKICSDKNVLLTAWTPICGFSKKYSLILAPGSHLKDHSPKTYIKSGMKVGLGGSVSVDQIGLLSYLTNKNDITLHIQYEIGIKMDENK